LGQEADSVRVDTLESVIIRPCDTCQTEDSTVVPDSLTEAQRALVDFEKRRQQFRDSLVIAPPGFSYSDSIVSYFASSRLSVSEDVKRSFFHDAGDYFRSDPAWFVLDHQVTPMRKTVQPFGLSGDRLNVINDGMNLHPFEHIVEPDGMVEASRQLRLCSRVPKSLMISSLRALSMSTRVPGATLMPGPDIQRSL
jgi:hypothetical protein